MLSVATGSIHSQHTVAAGWHSSAKRQLMISKISQNMPSAATIQGISSYPLAGFATHVAAEPDNQAS